MVGVATREAMRSAFFAAALAVGAGLSASIAHARVQEDFTYQWSQIWQTSVRMVRVDLRCAITDRDEVIGYVLFDYVDGGRTHPASIELVRASASNGTDRVRVVVSIPSMPSWVERMLLDRLTRKLRGDYGEQPVVRPAPPPQEEPEPPSEDPPAET